MPRKSCSVKKKVLAKRQRGKKAAASARELSILPPPAELAGEALCEWERVCAELTKLKSLDAADRAILTTYCEIWGVNRAAAATVRADGSTMEYSNGMVGPTPSYKNMIQTAALLRGLLSDLGLTRWSRKDRGNVQSFTLDLD